MKKILSFDAILTLTVAAILFAFFRYVHPELLNFHEEYQLFLLNSEYFLERALLPGGVAAWTAGFLTQFFYLTTIGAVVMAAMLVVLLLLVWRKVKFLPLALLPLALMVIAVGNQNLMPAYIVSIIIAMSVEAILPKKSHGLAVDIVLTTAAALLSYWLTGPMAWLTLLLIAARSTDGVKFSARIISIIIAAVAVVIATALSCNIAAYPAMHVITGLYYNRLPTSSVDIIGACVPVAIILLSILAEKVLNEELTARLKSSKWLLPAASLAVIIASAVVVPKTYNAEEYEHMRYDYYLRGQRWDDIVAFANKQMPTKPFGVCALNLALAMRGELCDRMFDYFQHGSEGLLPPFSRDYSSPLAAAEAYWQIGLVNTAQRYCFEVMEAIPDYQKSGRLIKRLVQTNIVNGEYGVARKYCQMLQQTLFYRSWAEKELARLNLKADEREKAINSDPVYGRLRQSRLDNDFLFSDKEIDKMMGQLFMKNSKNALAMQYLIAFPLLDKDPQRFTAYMTVVRQKCQYMPQAAREAASIIMVQQGKAAPQTMIQGSYYRYLNSN